VFLEQTEIEEFRVPLSSLTLITADDFDPNGALPLRFAPQGYTVASNYEVETIGDYITESGSNYVDESGSNNYTLEANQVYVAENGTDFYFADVSA